MHRLLTLDRKVSARCSLTGRWTRLLALVVAHSGDSLLCLLGATAALVWGTPAWRAVGERVWIGTLVAGTLIAVLKWLFRRQRPPSASGRGFYSPLDRHAFPSGHAGRLACLAVLLTPVLPKPWGCLLMSLWAGAVGLARVVLGVHFVLDVVAGWVIGAAVGLLLILLRAALSPG
ncbi:MAG: phosphatase PAP2 family protein [Anaerolineae bacterium]|nr:phosphatase PAP2 family protein [Anaerolineae bacterium]